MTAIEYVMLDEEEKSYYDHPRTQTTKQPQSANKFSNTNTPICLNNILCSQSCRSPIQPPDISNKQPTYALLAAFLILGHINYPQIHYYPNNPCYSMNSVTLTSRITLTIYATKQSFTSRLKSSSNSNSPMSMCLLSQE